MSRKVFSSGRTVELLAYDIALALAAKDPSLTTAKEMISRIEELMPECLAESEALYKKEHPYHDIGMFTRS